MQAKEKKISEDLLQNKIVMWYSQTYPMRKGKLFCVDNTSLNVKHGVSKKARGCQDGVSDLILLINGKTVGVELKSQDKYHMVNHVQNQIEWGKSLISEGGEYYFFTSLQEFQEYVCFGVSPKHTIDFVEKLILISGANIIFK